jgi:hypothetical protein
MDEKKPFHRKSLFFILSGSLLIILVAGFFYWRNYKYKLVNRQLDKLVTVKSKGLYEFNYKNLVINEALGNISAENIVMIPDSLVYQSLVAQHQAPENLFYIKIPALQITGVKTPKALLNKEISAHMIKIENADIEVRIGKANKETKTDVKENISSEIYQQLLGHLKSIKADSVVLENALLTLVEKESKTILCKAKGLSVRFSRIAIDSLNQNDSTQILFSKDMDIHCDQLDLPFKNRIYDLHVSGLDFNSQAGNFHTQQIRLKPRLSETAFAHSNHFAKDRIDLRLESLDITNIRRQGILHQQLLADSLNMTGLSIRIFRDKSYPHDSVDRTHDYPQEAIMLLPVPVYIKKIRIMDSYIEYKEKNDKSDSSGKVAFFHVQAGFDNVTNMPQYIRQNNQMLMHFNASFLNESPFNATIRMRLNDRKGVFIMDARLGEMNAPALNVILKPMALAELDKGKINSLRFHLDATNTHGKGKLILRYENLSIKLLKKDDDKNKYKTKVLPTLAAGILLKDSNPVHGKTRVGEVYYTRDIHRSIFNLMWKSLFAAIKEVAM